MKTPRVHDFDPNAQVPELASPLDNLPTIKPPSKSKIDALPKKDLTHNPQLPDLQEQYVFVEPKTERPNGRSLERPNVRRMRRRASYELYTDQIEAIQRLALEDKLQGGSGNQSEMVRYAIDEYLKQRRGEK